MSKQTVTNTWKDGLNKDLNPMMTPNTILTDNLNGTFITYNGNEFSLQNDMGNIYSSRLSEGFYPVGITEYGGIIYIVSVKDTSITYLRVYKADTVRMDQAIDDLVAIVSNIYPNFTENDAKDMLSVKGWKIPSASIGIEIKQEIDNDISSGSSSFTSTEYITEPSTKFEIGSFPSLDPTYIRDEEKELSLEYKYRPFYNLIRVIDDIDTIVPFSSDYINGYDLKHPVSIEIQPSYDGSVNVILTDDKNPPRLINSGFAVTKSGKGKFVKHNQNVKTNYYEEEKLDSLTRLVNISPVFTTIDLGTISYDEEKAKMQEAHEHGEEVDFNSIKTDGVQHGGQLKGGNYTFYFKFGDEDGNQTDIVCESGIVSIFKGALDSPKTISGAYNNEQTDKLIKLRLNNVDTNYSRIYVSYTREYCDLNGYRLVECKELVDPFKIDSSEEIITISGVEKTNDISIEDLNIYYHTITSAKTECQQQNMLFLGNVTHEEPNTQLLQNYSYEIEVSVSQSENIGAINPLDYSASGGTEYYDPYNIYYKLGYWPEELYRFGIVYIKSDGSLTQVFNVKGCKFRDPIGSNWDSNRKEPHKNNYWDKSDNGIFIKETECLDNLYGIFQTPKVNVLNTGEIRPLYFSFKLTDELVENFEKLGIIGYFIVRQKRLPITICQGLGIGVDKNAYIPMIQDENEKYVAESFITKYLTEGEVLDLSTYPIWYQNVVGIDESNDFSRKLVYNPITLNNEGMVEDIMPKEIYYYLYTSERWDSPWNKVTRYTCELRGPNGTNSDYLWCEDTSYDRQTAINRCADYYTANQTTINPNNIYTFSGIIRNTADYNYNQSKFKANVNPAFNKDRRLDSVQENGKGLLSVEAMTNPQIQSMLNGSKFTVESVNKCVIKEQWPLFTESAYESIGAPAFESRLVYIPENTPLKYIDNVGFSTQVGDGINAKDFGFLERNTRDGDEHNDMIVRGHFTPFIGAMSNKISPNILYNIKVPSSDTFESEFIIRANNTAEFFAATDKIPIYRSTDVYRGDCFTNTVTIRMHRNFIDQNAPIADKIVKPNCWNEYYHGYNNVAKDEDDEGKTQWNEINVGDLNTVSLGHWITFKCLSNSNLGLRSEDTFNTSEMALMGNPRSFYPLYGISTATGMKIADSKLLNDGYNATVSRRRNTIKQDTPYDKNEFSTRILFSNVSVSDSFTNGYRTFQGLSYRDYTKQYGAIIKLLPWGNNLFCVFEHGLAIIPINEKALLQTTTEQTIHIYGHGVLPEQISIISQDFGSIWADSIIRTPIGIYGIDTSAKKIWRYSDKKGLETLSDMKLQRFLNDNINIGLTKQELIGYTNVKTHYNHYKGDVMFTFYHTSNNNEETVKKEWNLCYNERQGLWTTRYSWIPLFSANIDNSFYTIPLTVYTDKNDITIWKHGRTEVDSKFKPTLWYGKQYPFEFEFVVNDPVGLHKVFENLVIISNNVQPSELEFQIIGDSYLFNRARIYHDAKNIYGNEEEDRPYKIELDGYNKDNFAIADFKPMFYNARVEYDPVLDEYNLIITQPCKNKETYGVRLGNIQYKEDSWYTNIEPLRYNTKLNKQDAENFSINDEFASAKIRDKWLKIRIKYIGDQLSIISGVITFENLSYA